LGLAGLKSSAAYRYGGGLVFVIASLVLRAAITPLVGERHPLLFAILAVVAAAAYFGSGSAIVTAILAAAGCFFLFQDRAFLPNAGSVGLLPYFLVCFFIIIMAEAMRRASRRADERLAQLREESALREREQEISGQLRALVESSGDAIASMDLTGAVTSWNRAAERTFGYSAEEALGRPISFLTPPDQAGEAMDAIAEVRQGGGAKQFETVRLHKNGIAIEVSLTISPIHDPKGGLSGVSYIARDITERKRYEERLLQSQKLESLGVLAGGLAHDFNNLLTGIIGNTSLVMRGVKDQASRDRLESVLRAGDHAALLVKQMLAFAGKGAFVIGKIDLSKEIEDMKPLLHKSVPRWVTLDFRLAGGLPLVSADHSQIQQLVMNLVVNAAESIEGTGSVSIVTRTAPRERVTLEVRDTGCGMDEATKARIFEPFFTTKFTGRGLGLAAVMGIIRAQHGDIEVESEPGRGSMFRITLPAIQAEEAARV
jgi:PAS domain S-box-containing protein